ncbi:MAG: recombinase family protein [Sinimarinibacterium sp.]|jgi:DNA invertase Pin-like site-specific DNA recombinase
MRAVIYARYSTDQQSATSIDDQARVCRQRAAALGFDVVAVHSDRATSGQTCVGDRPGGRALLADQYDVLILEGLDRLSRDAVENETIVRRLEHRGVRIIGVSDGYDSAAGGQSRGLLRMMRGAINETYIHDLRAKIHRGLVGQLERGYHAGGLSYGYRSVVAGVDAKNEPIGFRLELVDEQAEVVREIFARYADGASCQKIAAELNRRGVRGPRGGTWCVSALYGSPAKGAGVLNNELYVGRYIWNRSRWVKDPDTRKRQRLQRPASEWKIEQRPELRILDDAMWTAVRTRMQTTRDRGGRGGRGGFPTTLFGGLLRCGICGGAVVAISASAYGCAARRDRGTAVCTGISAPRRAVDATLLDHVQQAVQAPALVARMEREAALLLGDRGRQDDSRQALRKRGSELDKEIGRLADGIAAIGVSPALAERLRAAEAERERIRTAQELAPVIRAPSDARALVRAALNGLSQDLGKELPQARDALRAALGDIRLVPEEDGVFAVFEDTSERLLMRAVGDGMGLVAGTCNLTRLRVA